VNDTDLNALLDRIARGEPAEVAASVELLRRSRIYQYAGYVAFRHALFARRRTDETPLRLVLNEVFLRLRNGDRNASDLAVELTLGVVAPIVVRFVHTCRSKGWNLMEDEDDWSMKVVTAIFQKIELGAFRGGNAIAWLNTVAANRMRDYARKIRPPDKRPYVPMATGEDGTEETLDAALARQGKSTPSQAIQNAEAGDAKIRVRQVLATAKKFDELDGEIFFLHEDGLTFREIAEQKDKTVAYVSSRYYAVKKHLKQAEL